MSRRVLASLCLAAAVALGAVTLSGCGSHGAPTAPGASGQGGSTVGPKAGSGLPSSPATSNGGATTAAVVANIARADLLEPPADYAGFEPLPSFTYHHIAPKAQNDITTSPKMFEAQLKLLKTLGYHTVTARQVVDHQRKGTPLPDKPVMITFDDGWRTQYTYAWPLLKKYGFVATFFVNPQPISARYIGYLTRDMVVALDKAGNDIESHTWRHFRVTRTNAETTAGFQAKNIGELTRANAWIKTVTRKPVVALCYPYGYYDLESIGMAQRAGYVAAWSVDEGVADARPWDAFQMKRFTINSGETLDSFRRRLLSGPLPVTGIQPPPGSRIKGNVATITVDISAVPSTITDIHLMGIPKLGPMQIVERDGKKFAEAPIAGPHLGFHAIAMRGTGPDGRMFYNAWGLETGDQ